MRRWQRAAALSTCFLTLTAGMCQPNEIAVPLMIPAERTDCPASVARPTIPAEQPVNWALATSVALARQAHEAFVASVRAREGIVAGHVVKLEGQLFDCGNDAQWVREYQKGLKL